MLCLLYFVWLVKIDQSESTGNWPHKLIERVNSQTILLVNLKSMKKDNTNAKRNQIPELGQAVKLTEVTVESRYIST